MLDLMEGVGRGGTEGTSGVLAALLDGLWPPPLARLRLLAPWAKGRRWHLGWHYSLPACRHPAGRVYWVRCSPPDLGTKPKGHGAIPAGMGHSVTVWLGHQPLGGTGAL